MTAIHTLPAHENPWPPGTAEAAEFYRIVARLADPEQERRYARYLAQRESPALIPAPLPEEEHAGQLAGLSAAGVLFGPDCSYFQGLVAWARVKAAGCALGGYKVSEGMTYQDPQHQNNRRNVPAAGLVPLAYHYMSPTSPAAAQADWFCSLVDPNAIHALDVEAAKASPGLDVSAWTARYFQHFPHKILFDYSNRSLWLNRSHVTDPWPAGVEPWHAGYRDGLYTSATGALAAEWAAIGSLTNSLASLGAPRARLWQFTDHAAVPGVSGTCDGNAFQGTLTELKALAGQNGDTHMSAEDVAALKSYLGSDAFLGAVADALGTRVSYRDKDPIDPTKDLTWDRILNETYRNARGANAVGDELSPTALQAVVNALRPVIDTSLQTVAAGLPDAVAAKLGGNADAGQVKAAVAEALQENLPTFNIVADPGPAAARRQ